MIEQRIQEVALFNSRHPIYSVLTKEPITDSVFGDSVENPLDFNSMQNTALRFLQESVWDNVTKIHLYIKGLTPATTSFLKSYFDALCPIRLSLFHYNRDTQAYEEQKSF